jgi:hypothetical protein
MIYLGLGVLLLLAGLWLLRLFVEANPAQLARGVRQAGIALIAVLALALFVYWLASRRLGAALADLGGLAILLLRTRSLWWRYRAASGPAAGQTSAVDTDTIAMRLDHDSGAMTGTVLKGRFQGRHLDELSLEQLIALWRDCRVEDEAAASLLEAYLDRLPGDWRAAAASGPGMGEEGASPYRAADAMTPEEAYAVLGLEAGAGEAAIREAHRRLMMKLHPDQGGSTYLAAKLNRAREILLNG